MILNKSQGDTVGKTPRAVPTLSRRKTDKLGWWYQGIVDLRDGAILSRTPSGAADFIAQLLLKHPEGSSAAKARGRYLAFCGHTPHVSERFMLHEEREISEEINRLVSRIGESGGDADEVTPNIRLRVAGNRRNLEEWLESQQKRRKVEVQPKEVESAIASIRELVTGLVSNVSPKYSERRDRLRAVSDAFRQEMAVALEAALNDHLQTLPQDTFEDKKTIAKYVNAELRRFGLALRGPSAGDPCILRADPGGHPGRGRFQLDYTDGEGKRRYIKTSATLMPLELVADDLGRAPGHRSERFR